MSRLLVVLLRSISRAPSFMDSLFPTFLGRRTWLRARNVALERHPRSFVRVIEPEGITFRGTTRDVIQRSIMLHGVWEPDISNWMRSFVQPGDLVVDVGANSGYYSLLLSRIVGPSGTVLAFEPVPSIHAQFCQRLEANGAENVEVLNVALGSAAGSTEVYRASDDNVGNSSTVAEAGHTSEGRVRVTPGDDVLASRATRIRFVKIDTEGDEFVVLDGMRGTLAKMRSGSAVLVEITPEKLGLRGHSSEAIWNLFVHNGWSATRIRNDYDFAEYGTAEHPSMRQIAVLPEERCDIIFVKD